MRTFTAGTTRLDLAILRALRKARTVNLKSALHVERARRRRLQPRTRRKRVQFRQLLLSKLHVANELNGVVKVDEDLFENKKDKQKADFLSHEIRTPFGSLTQMPQVKVLWTILI
jgi:signal transduction histidine kinase